MLSTGRPVCITQLRVSRILCWCKIHTWHSLTEHWNVSEMNQTQFTCEAIGAKIRSIDFVFTRFDKRPYVTSIAVKLFLFHASSVPGNLPNTGNRGYFPWKADLLNSYFWEKSINLKYHFTIKITDYYFPNSNNSKKAIKGDKVYKIQKKYVARQPDRM